MGKFSRRTIDNQIERRLATGFIVSTQVLTELAPMYDGDLIQVPYVRTICGWCLEYFKKYGEAPMEHIQDIYNGKSKMLDSDVGDLIEKFLNELSEEYERADKFNSKYLIDEVMGRFAEKELTNLSDDIRAELANGDVGAAQDHITAFKKVAKELQPGVNPLRDTDALIDAFERHVEPLFTFPGAIGDFINEELVRGGLLGVMGRAKIGKTWILMEVTYQAVISRCNVVWVHCGDMNQQETMTRFYCRLAGKNHRASYCRDMASPVLDCEKNQRDECDLRQRVSDCGLGGAQSLEDAPEDYKPCSVCCKVSPKAFRGATWYEQIPKVKPLTWREALKAGRRLGKRTSNRHFKLINYPNKTLTVDKLEQQLDRWEVYEGFVPDVVVVDYADIMAPEYASRNEDSRHQHNNTWQALRRMTQSRHLLGIVGTQADSGSYDFRDLSLKNFSEDRRKNDHVTGLLALNQTMDEKEIGEWRAAWLLLREGEYDPRKQVVMLQCLQRAQPLIASYYKRWKKKA